VEAGIGPEGVAPHQLILKKNVIRYTGDSSSLIEALFFRGLVSWWWHLWGYPQIPISDDGGCQVSDEQQMRRENQQLKELRHEELRGILAERLVFGILA